MYCDKITFVIFAYNEAERIERAVRNFRDFGRVLVVDNLSSDRTRMIATAAGAQVLDHKNPGWVEDENTVAIVKAAVTTPWIYWAYSDEIVGKPTLEACLALVEDGRVDIIRLARMNYYYGVFCHGAYANQQNRFFRKDAIDFSGNEIHNFGRTTVAESSIVYMDPKKYFVHHFISNDAKSYLRTIDSYTDIQATKTVLKGGAALVLYALKSFLVNYFLRRGYKAGMPGLFLGLQMTYYEAILNMKAYEIQFGLNPAAIENKNNALRDVLLSELRSDFKGELR
jgi:glycosyltransferase involved in cell wall biosynthesis